MHVPVTLSSTKCLPYTADKYNTGKSGYTSTSHKKRTFTLPPALRHRSATCLRSLSLNDVCPGNGSELVSATSP